MAWINPRQIFYFFLLTVCSQTGQCCKKMFAKPMYEAIVPPQLLKGNVVLKVIFYHCNFGDHIKLHTNDANFGIHSDGTVYATRPLLIKSEYYFQVRAKDLRTHEKWKVPIQLMPFANQSKTVLKNEHPKIYFRKADHFRRQKREWIIPPLDVREHEPPSHNPIGSIVSDIQFDVLTYTISGPGADRPPVGLFVIDHRTGDLNITGEVDREKTPQFRLIGQAWNSRNQAVENPLELVIKVQDINDNRPEFTKEVFEGSVEELSRFGTFVLSLNATDKDEGENAQIFYRILHQGGKEMFVSNSNGEIKTLATDLDRETQDLYTLLVEARDLNGRAEGLYATANVQIRILDVNDNIPTTEKEEYEVSVQENTLNDDVIRIKVIDKDQEFTDNWLGNIEIIEGNADGNFRFEMDEQTNEGILILQKELDYEESSTRNLVLKVSNKAAYHASVLSGGGGGGGLGGGGGGGGGGGLGGGGGPIRDGGLKPIKLKVNVKDQKEGFSFKPTKKRIGVGENKKKVHVGQKLGKYPAISVDTGKESEGVRYAKGLDPANLFNINPDTSEITLAKVPDREAEYIVDGKYTATVLAISNDGPTPKTSTGTVVIEVEDENDNIPIIENLQPCMCDTAKSLIITAEDLDSYPNGAPFTFKFDDVPEVAEKWKILRRDDTSVELQPRHELWPGVFTVPLKVEDNQGSGKVQDVEVHVVECTNNSPSCSERAKPIRGNNARLGAAAIGLMAFGALLLLLAPLLLLFCNSGLGGIGGAGGFKQIPIETFGTVEHKNIEGGGERDTHMPLLPVSAATAAAVGTYPSEMDSRKGGAGAMEQNLLPLNMNSSDVLYTNYIGNSAMQEGVNVQGDAHCLSYMESNMNMGVMENGRIRTMSEDALLDFMDSYIDEKVDTHNLEDQTSPGHDTLLIYNYEGDGSLAGSIDSCNFIEGGFETGDSYLDNLDLKFKTLADICTGKLESQEITVSVDAPVHQEIVKKERSVSSSSVGLQAMNIIPDSTLMRKNYVVTTTINPVVDMVPLAASQAFDHQNIVVTNQVNTVPRRINIIENPNIAHQNIVMTKMVNGGAEVIPDMIIDPSVAHQSVIVTEQFRNSCRGNPAMIFNPSVTHHNAVVTNVIEGGAGDMQGMIAQPHTVEKNVMVTKSIHKGDSQSTLSDSSLDHIPTIHKNVTLKKSAKSAMEGVQSSTVPNEAMVQKTRVSRRSVTSSDNNVHSSVTKVTKVAQVMQ